MLDMHMPGQVDGEELLFQLRDQSYEIPKQPDQRTALRMGTQTVGMEAIRHCQ